MRFDSISEPSRSVAAHVPDSRFTLNRAESIPGRGFALSMPGVRESMPSAAALHEAGHAIALLASGYYVQLLEVMGEGGRCLPATPVCPRVMAIVAAAGPIAEALDGSGCGTGSRSDDWYFTTSLGSRDASEVATEAADLVSRYRGSILFLAAALDRLGTIQFNQFVALCHEQNSPLAPYQLYYSRQWKPTVALGTRVEGGYVRS